MTTNMNFHRNFLVLHVCISFGLPWCWEDQGHPDPEVLTWRDIYCESYFVSHISHVKITFLTRTFVIINIYCNSIWLFWTRGPWAMSWIWFFITICRFIGIYCQGVDWYQVISLLIPCIAPHWNIFYFNYFTYLLGSLKSSNQLVSFDVNCT